jgi:hypothetical protein
LACPGLYTGMNESKQLADFSPKLRFFEKFNPQEKYHPEYFVIFKAYIPVRY